MFRLDGTEWVEEQKLVPSDATGADYVRSVAVEGDMVVVGAILYDCPGMPNCGAVYVFRFDGSLWVEAERLTAPDADGGEWLGASVAVSGTRVLTGASLDNCAAGVYCGSAYIFDVSGLDADCNCNGTADVCERDTDRDNLIDECDACPDSIQSQTIAIGVCDTGVLNAILDDGCTMADVLAECGAGRRSHGDYVTCANETARAWKRDRLITGSEFADIVACAAQSNTGRSTHPVRTVGKLTTQGKN